MRIFPVAFVTFILVPVLEIYLLIKVGSHIGAFNTVLLVLGTAALGAALLRRQGVSTLQEVQRQLQRGEMPASSMLEAMLVFIAGVLLLTPGFFTDSIGLLLMIPPLRRVIALWLLERSGWIVTIQPGPGERRDERHTLEGEYRRRDE